MADARRLAELGMVPGLAKELAAQITAGVGDKRRLAELSMVPRLALEAQTQINSKTVSVRRLVELGMSPSLASEAVAQITGAAPPSPVPGVEVWRLRFETGQYTLNGSPIAAGDAISTIRTTAGTGASMTGAYASFAAGAPVITNRGLLAQPTRAPLIRYPRDLTQTVWEKTNATVTKDQVGIDGVANAASRMTATANGATVLQPNTAAATNRWPAFTAKRLSGSGALTATLDGVNYYPTFLFEPDRYFIAFPDGKYWQNIANPTFGWKMELSGDSWMVDGSQLDNAQIGTSTPILNGATAVSRGADTVALTDALRLQMTMRRGTILAKVRNLQSIAAIGTFPQVINARIDAANKVGVEIGTGPLPPGADSSLARYLQAFIPYKDGLFIQKRYSQSECGYNAEYKIAVCWDYGMSRGAFSNGSTGLLSEGSGVFDDVPPVFVGIGNNNGGQHGSMYIADIAYYNGVVDQSVLDAYVA